MKFKIWRLPCLLITDMAASVGITFVNESQNFDLEKSGKSTRRRREKWSWLYLVEEEESDRESTESSPETEIANSEIESSESENPESASSETESSESAPSSVVSSSPSSGEEYEEEGQDETIEAPTVTKSKAKPKGTANKKPSSGPSKSKSNSAGQSAKPRTRKTKETSAITKEDLEDLCFELGERKDELKTYTTEKLQAAGDVNFFASRGSLRSTVISKLPELLDEVNESFMETMRSSFAKKVSKAERKAFLSHCWTQKLPSLLQNEIWCGVVKNCCESGDCSDVSRGDQISVLACITEAVFDFAHMHSRNKITSSNSAPDTQLCAENDVILHRFGGAAIYRMEKVRKNTINEKKGTMKVTVVHKESLKKELEIIQQMRRKTMTNLPRELSVHLNEGGLHFMKDEMIDFVRKADNHTRKFTVSRVFRRNPASFLKNVFASVYGSEELFNSFVSSVASIGILISGYDQQIVKAVYRELLTKLCRTRVKSFMQGLKEKDLETDKKVCDVDSSLRDKLKGYVMTSKR